MPETNEKIFPKLLPQFIATILIAASTTVVTNYTNARISENVDEQQTKILDELDHRVRDIELDRYTAEDANQDREAIVRELDRIYQELEKLGNKFDNQR